MIKPNVTISQQAGFGMPMTGSVRVASVRALPTTGAVCAAAAGSKRDRFDVSSVWTDSSLAGIDVVTGTAPGTSAWSPPIW